MLSLSPRVRGVFLAVGLAGASVALAGASCDKKPALGPGPGPTVTPPADATAHGSGEPKKPLPEPVLTPGESARFDKLVEVLPSPCGAAHSLKTSFASDASCKRAGFALPYVKRLIKAELTDEEITAFYGQRYRQAPPAAIDLGKAPFEGVPNAPIVIVEYFDYGCPHCKDTAPRLEDLLAEFPSEVVLYFKHFPLSIKSPSLPAAVAAVAAQNQGKFREMHRKLFADQDSHAKEDLFRMAREIGLDLPRFEADWNDPASRARVMADRDEGDANGVEGTPQLFVNGRMYSDPLSLEDFRDWVLEELAMNR